MRLNLNRLTAIATLCAIVSLGIWFFSKPAPIRFTASGQLQDGRHYAASCELGAMSSFSRLGVKTYLIRSLDLKIDGNARAVPANALDGITVHDPKQRLQVSEEGPVVVLSIRAGENEHPVQWRYLNGFFAQRRILDGEKIAIHNADAKLQAPTMVSNVSPDAPRRLGSPSLLSSPEETPRTPLKNGHE